MHRLAKHLPAFRVRHPKVSVELSVPGLVETVDDNFDVTISRNEGSRSTAAIARRLVTAASPTAFSQALGMLHKRGTMSLVGLPPGDFALPIFDVVLNAKTVRGSIVGTRKDLQEALDFAGEGRFAASAAKTGSTTSMPSFPGSSTATSKAG